MDEEVSTAPQSCGRGSSTPLQKWKEFLHRYREQFFKAGQIANIRLDRDALAALYREGFRNSQR